MDDTNGREEHFYVYLVFMRSSEENQLRIGKCNNLAKITSMRRRGPMTVTHVYAIQSKYEVETDAITWELRYQLRDKKIEGGLFRVDDDLFDVIDYTMRRLNEAQDPFEEVDYDDSAAPMFPSLTGEGSRPEELEEILLHPNDFKIYPCARDGIFGENPISGQGMRETIVS